LVARSYVDAFGIDSRQLPVAVLCLGEMTGIGRHCVAMIGIHVIDGALLALFQSRKGGAVAHKVGALEKVCPGEAAIEDGARWFEPEKGEIVETGIKLRLRLPVEISP